MHVFKVFFSRTQFCVCVRVCGLRECLAPLIINFDYNNSLKKRSSIIIIRSECSSDCWKSGLIIMIELLLSVNKCHILAYESSHMQSVSMKTFFLRSLYQYMLVAFTFSFIAIVSILFHRSDKPKIFSFMNCSIHGL